MTATEPSTTRLDSKGRTLLPSDLRIEYDLGPGDSLSWKKTKAGWIISPAKKTDYVAKFKEMIQTPPKRTGKPQNPTPAEMKQIWKET